MVSKEETDEYQNPLTPKSNFIRFKELSHQAKAYGFLTLVPTKAAGKFSRGALFLSEILEMETPILIEVSPPYDATRWGLAPDPAGEKRVRAFWQQFASHAEDSSLVISHHEKTNEESCVLTIGSASDLAILRMMV